MGEISASHVERCRYGIALTGFDVSEGWNDSFGSISDVTLVDNAEADLKLQAWSVKETATQIVRQAPPGQEVAVQGWPAEKCSVVVPTDRGAVILLFDASRINATLFEDEEDNAQDYSYEGSPVRCVSDADEGFTLQGCPG